MTIELSSITSQFLNSIHSICILRDSKYSRLSSLPAAEYVSWESLLAKRPKRRRARRNSCIRRLMSKGNKKGSSYWKFELLHIKLYGKWCEIIRKLVQVSRSWLYISSSRNKTVPYSCEDLMTFAPKDVLLFTSWIILLVKLFAIYIKV